MFVIQYNKYNIINHFQTGYKSIFHVYFFSPLEHSYYCHRSNSKTERIGPADAHSPPESNSTKFMAAARSAKDNELEPATVTK